MATAKEFNSRADNGNRSSLTSLEVRFAKSPLSGSRRRLIREILDKHEETFFLSSRELAKRQARRSMGFNIRAVRLPDHRRATCRARRHESGA